MKICTRAARRSFLLAGIAPFTMLAATVPAHAQDAPATEVAQDDTAQDTAKDIVVTGSRIARPELDSPTPVAIVGSADIRRGGSTNIQDVLAKLPQVGIPGLSNTNSNFLTSGNGVSTINLRNLGDARTLVLVNGRRFVAGLAGTSVVDVNNIPADFIDRVEVVTGGASSIYGSDAIAGVVNFVLKDKIEGLTARAQAGITDKGDNPRYNISVTGGTSFGADEAGGIIANFTYDKDGGLLSRDRAISAEDCSFLGCGPQSYSSYSAQGRFQLFNNGRPTGNNGFTTELFSFDPSNNLVLGAGDGFNRNAVRRISTPVERYMGNVAAHYDITPEITAFVEGTYVKVKSSSAIEPAALDSELDVGAGYSIDNPFVPAAIKAQIAARNGDADPTNDVDHIAFRRRQNEVFSRSNNNRRETWRVAAGFKGTVAEKFNYELSYVHGELKDHTYTEDLDISKYANALDAITVGGQVVCRDVAARAAGCVPINLFGYNSVSPAAAAYVTAAMPREERIKNTEDVFSANISGPLFQVLPAGAVQASIGAEYRREKSVDDWDALTNAGLNSGNKTPDTVGKFNVKEVFGELSVPILKDQPFFHSLSLTGAARYSSYSTIGDVFSWNAGAEWAPVSGLRFRGNYAVANRAPNINELFQPPSETFPTGISDPCNGITATTTGTLANTCRAIPGVNATIANSATHSFTYTPADLQSINGFDGGNTALQEEKAKTLTLGMVLAPRALRGFNLTIDYFNIKVDNAIGIIDRQTSIEQCLTAALPQFCANVLRNPNTGFIRTVNAQNVNIASLKTSGIDTAVRYGRELGLVSNDRLDFNVLWTHTFKFDTQADVASPVRHGVGNLEFGGAFTNGAVFRDKVTGRLNYELPNGFGLSWSTTFVSSMYDQDPYRFEKNSATGDPVIDGHNKIKARLYHDVQLKTAVGEKFELFFGVNNLFDRKPPKLEDTVFTGTITGTTTAADVYDPFGRRFYAGAQVRF
ncbi:TonB-dependent receptor plug domain-containing protein [Sphingomonas sp.]|uniref:TonB-dependent receptor plug domain-containing protein n=1 Tax=Sphingomonas sp. TaxID=28214 RepID=UPI003D6D64DA